MSASVFVLAACVYCIGAIQFAGISLLISTREYNDKQINAPLIRSGGETVCGIKLVDAESKTKGTVGHSGLRLSLPNSGVHLTVGEGAVSRGEKKKAYLAVMRADRERVSLPGMRNMHS